MENRDYLIRAVSSDGFVKATAILSRNIVERARQIHKTSPLASAALGRTLTAAAMMGNALKEDNGSVTVRIDGDGILGSVIAVSDSMGNVRGYLQNPAAELPLRDDGKLDVGRGIGQGSLYVAKDIGLKEPFSGCVQLVDGEIADDIAAYFNESEQVPTACALGVLVDTDLSIKTAGGYIIQLMPGAGEDVIERVEKGVFEAGAVTKLLSEGMSPEDILKRVLSEFDISILEKTYVEYKCMCGRERVIKALISIGKDELNKIISEQENIEVTCQFCDAVYSFNKYDVGNIVFNA